MQQSERQQAVGTQQLKMTEDSTKDETAVSSAGKKTAMASKNAEGSSSNEETGSTEVFTRRFYILAVFSIFTMEQVQEQMSFLFKVLQDLVEGRSATIIRSQITSNFILITIFRSV